MKNVMLIIVVLISFLNPKQSVSSSDMVPVYITEAANKFGIDTDLMFAICKVESRCMSGAVNGDDGTRNQKNRHMKVISHGLFQLQLATAESLGFVRYRTEIFYTHRHHKTRAIRIVVDHRKDLFKPEINTYYAAKLLRVLSDRYEDDLIKVISAYNAGHYTKHNVKYVHMVMKWYITYKMSGINRI